MSAILTNPEQEAREYAGRYKVLYVLLGLITTVVCVRLWYLQIMMGAELRAFSEKNRIKETKVPAPRGLIFDRDGRELVENLPGFEVNISPQYAQDIQKTAKAVGQVLGMEESRIFKEINESKKRNGPYRPVRIKDNLSLEEVFKLKLLRLDHPGLNIDETIVRSYPMQENGAQLFGYVGEISDRQIDLLNQKHQGRIRFFQGDIIGKGGLEESLEGYIRGKDGVSFLQVDARGREAASDTPSFVGQVFANQEPIPGDNLVLTIDKDIQQAAFNSFVNRGRMGAIVAMKTNGEILAWVSTPAYDPNKFSVGIPSNVWAKLVTDPFKPLRNKVIQDHVWPGSSFKPLVALAALQEKEINQNTVWYCPGVMKFGGRPYHDSKREGHGNLNVMQAIERSSNIFFYRIGIALGIDNISKYVGLLGLGQRTNVDIRGEVPGVLPTTSWKKQWLKQEWQPGENLTNAIGQGFVLATPIQMAVAYSAIATRGQVYKPFVVKKILNNNGKVIKEFQPQLIRDASEPSPDRPHIDKKNFDIVREGMWMVNNGGWGTARGMQKIPGIEVAGKTGTSQVMGFSADQIYAKCENRPIHQRHHGWYIGFAPYENPEIVVAVLAEHSCHGSSGAGPTARDVIEAYMMKYHSDVIEAAKLAKKGKKPEVIQAPVIPPQEGED